MALSLRGVAESTAAADPTITHPGGIAQNDVVIFAVHTDETSNQDLSMITTGYTELADVYANDNFDTNLGVFRKIMGATPDSSAQAETGSATGLAVEHVWTGADTTTPEDATTTTVTKTNGSRADPPAITTVTADAVVIAICSSAYQQTGTLSEPTGYSNLVDVGESVTGHVMMASKAKASPGAEDPGIFNGFNNGVSDSAASGAAATVALRPGTSGAYTLSLATVAWTRSVTAVALERGREIVPASVSWARTVTDVTFTKGKTVTPETVAWARSVQAVSYEHGWEIAPASVSWARSVSAVALEQGREIVPESVAWARSVADVTFTLLADKVIVPETVAWSRSVQDVSFEHGYELIPEAVNWTRSVGDVTLIYIAGGSPRTLTLMGAGT